MMMMKLLTVARNAVIVALAVVALGVGVRGVGAQSQPDLTTGADYMPANTVFYFATRSDDALVDDLDALVARVGETVPMAAMPATLREQLDQALSGLYRKETTFTEGVGAWLGDSIAIGVPSVEVLLDDDFSNDDEVPVVAVVGIDNKATAIDFLSRVAEEGTGLPEAEEVDGYTVYSDAPSNTVLAIGETVAFIGVNTTLDEILAGSREPLSGSTRFNDAISRLPESSYALLAYAELGDVLGEAVNMASPMEFSESGMTQAQMSAIFAAVPQVAFGATAVGDGTLVLDIATTAPDAEAFAASGMTLPTYPTEAVDPGFARFIPAGTPLVLHSVDLAGRVDTGVTVFNELIASMLENETMTQEELDEALLDLTNAELVLRGLTGLEFVDFYSWISGDYAIALDVTTEVSEGVTPTVMPLDFVIVAEATDAAAAANVASGLADAANAAMANAEDAEISVTNESIGGAEVTVITITSDDMMMPVNGEMINVPLEVLVGANDAVFALGTRRMVENALSPSSGLDSDATFSDAAATTLSGANAIAYISGEALLPSIDGIVALAGDAMRSSDAADLTMLLTLVRHATISVVYEEDGSSVQRWAITIP